MILGVELLHTFNIFRRSNIETNKPMKAGEESSNKLTAKQEKFCQLYASNKEFFGNGVQTYIEVYDPDISKPNWYKSACASASQILSNIKVCERINELLEENGLNDQNVDKQLLFLVNQHADFKSKIAAIREYNKLKQRIVERTDITSGGKPIPLLASLDDVRNHDGSS